MAMTGEQIAALVSGALPDARVHTQDLTGTQDHWGIQVTWPGFAEMDLLEQHRKVMEILQPHLEGTGSGAIHAVQIQTLAKE